MKELTLRLPWEMDVGVMTSQGGKSLGGEFLLSELVKAVYISHLETCIRKIVRLLFFK